MILRIDTLSPAKGANCKKVRKGRGHSSGKGRSCTRGLKGSGQRAGYSTKASFEGGQMPLARRIPKRGFSNKNFARKIDIVNLSQLQEKFKSGEKVDPASLKEKGLIKGKNPVKILGNGELKKKLKISACILSSGAKEKIQQAGGDVE